MPVLAVTWFWLLVLVLVAVIAYVLLTRGRRP